MIEAGKRPVGPLVSIVIPSYNRASYISETVSSVLAQTYDNLEIIVINDGSTDNTNAVMAQFADKVHYIERENAERGASRNHGLHLASGDYIAFLDSDDVWLPTKIEQDVAFLEAHPDVGVVYSDFIQIDSKGNDLHLVPARGPSGRVTANLLERNFIGFATHLARTMLVRKIGGFREERRLSGAEDWEMLVRLSLEADFAYNPVAKTRIRTHPGNTMTNAAAMQRSLTCAAEMLRESEQLSAHFGKQLRHMDAQIALINAINYCSQAERSKSFKFLKSAFLASPWIIFDPRFAYTVYRLLKRNRRTSAAFHQI